MLKKIGIPLIILVLLLYKTVIFTFDQQMPRSSHFSSHNCVYLLSAFSQQCFTILQQIRERVKSMLHQAETLIAKSCYHGDGIRQWATAVEKRYKDFARRMQKYRAKLENKLGYTVSEHEVWRSLSYFLLLTQPPLPKFSVCSSRAPSPTPFSINSVLRLNKSDFKSKGQTKYRKCSPQSLSSFRRPLSYSWQVCR